MFNFSRLSLSSLKLLKRNFTTINYISKLKCDYKLSHSNSLHKQQLPLIQHFSNYYYFDHGHEIKHEDPSFYILTPNASKEGKSADGASEQSGMVISPDNKFLTLRWRNDATDNYFHSLWLRRECHCSKCLWLGSKQYYVPPESLLPPVTLEKVTRDEEWLQLTWRQKNGELHEGRIPLQWLYYNRESFKATTKDIVDTDSSGVVKEFDYSSLMESKKELYGYLYQINDSGIALVNGAPADGLKPLAELISYRYNCCWGLETEVKIRVDELHSTYSNNALAFHRDMTYYEHFAGLTHLHCVQNSACVDGGILALKDAFKAANAFRNKFPAHFKTLSETRLWFDNINLNSEAPTFQRVYDKNITLDENGDIAKISWSPLHQGPLLKSSDGDLLERYFAAFAAFDKYLNEFPAALEVHYTPGLIVSIHNLKMIHGRTKIHLNGGVRHLKLCHTPLDEFRSKLRYMCFILGKDQPKKVW